jgi:hypothetical protein
MSLRNRIERLEREFFPQANQKTMTWEEFQFLYHFTKGSQSEFDALPRGVRSHCEMLWKILVEAEKGNSRKAAALQVSLSAGGKSAAAPAPKRNPNPKTSGSQATG